jgi:predicted methyltransferase
MNLCVVDVHNEECTEELIDRLRELQERIAEELGLDSVNYLSYDIY